MTGENEDRTIWKKLMSLIIDSLMALT